MTEPRYAETPADIPTPQVLLSMSGMDYMQAMLAGRFPGPPIARTLNFNLVSIAPGRAVFRGTPLFDYANPMGGVHGGWYGTVIDSAVGCAVMTTVPQGSWYTTLEYKVNITRALAVGTEVECIGTVQHAGRSTAVAEAVMRGVADGRIYATGSTTCIIMQG